MGHVWHLFVIQHERRDELRSQLAARGVGTLVHYEIPPHLTRAYRAAGACLPVTERLANRVLSLPLRPQLSDEVADAVTQTLRSVAVELRAGPRSRSPRKSRLSTRTGWTASANQASVAPIELAGL
jgi:dTDP-4-amino-4,6-dideoxygalactose transaminase